jgi:hypothetical protein
MFARNGTLMAASFDLKTLELRGEPQPIVEGVMHAVRYVMPPVLSWFEELKRLVATN